MINTILSSEYIYFIFLMALTAIPVGFFAGLLGIGGGLITVPVLYYIFGSFGLDDSFIMHLAVGTSFSIIIPTSIASTLTHMKFKAVNISLVKSYGFYVVFGVFIGTIFAASLKTADLILFFSIVTFILSFYFLISKEKGDSKPRKIKLFIKIFLGLVAGFFSAPMGIAGGVINTPFFKIFGYPINVAIGTSAAIGFLIAIAGTFGFLLTGNYLNINAPFSLGFINIPAFLVFVPITTLMAKVGAKVVHKIDKKIIGKFYGIFLLIVSLRLFFEYLSY